MVVEIIEDIDDWRLRFGNWKPSGNQNDLGPDYPFVKNQRAPFTPARRALPMLNLALISSAGAYIDGTPGFDTQALSGDLTARRVACHDAQTGGIREPRGAAQQSP